MGLFLRGINFLLMGILSVLQYVLLKDVESLPFSQKADWETEAKNI
jgi:hypothetical protein